MNGQPARFQSPCFLILFNCLREIALEVVRETKSYLIDDVLEINSLRGFEFFAGCCGIAPDTQDIPTVPQARPQEFRIQPARKIRLRDGFIEVPILPLYP